MKQLTLSIIGTLLIGCAATISKQEIAAVDFGALPKNYKLVVQNYWATRLRDPFTAYYHFDEPRKGFAQDGAFAGGKRHYGWIVPTWINAKNGFGGYTGPELHTMLLYEGKVSDITDMVTSGMAGPASSAR